MLYRRWITHSVRTALLLFTRDAADVAIVDTVSKIEKLERT